jgi:hypothetical protein
VGLRPIPPDEEDRGVLEADSLTITMRVESHRTISVGSTTSSFSPDGVSPLPDAELPPYAVTGDGRTAFEAGAVGTMLRLAR